jgi:hypothetical protein
MNFLLLKSDQAKGSEKVGVKEVPPKFLPIADLFLIVLCASQVPPRPAIIKVRHKGSNI